VSVRPRPATAPQEPRRHIALAPWPSR
jgi:hypothetical protein